MLTNNEKIHKVKAILGQVNTEKLKQTKEYALLEDKGFIIDEAINETSIADMVYLCDVMDSRLDLTIMPTEDCNFRCRYCYETFKKGQMSEESIKSFQTFLYANIRRFSAISVSWFGGEPLEALPQIEKISKIILTAVKARKIPYDAGIVTNGYNLTLDYLKRMIDVRITQIQVTLDGKKEYHDKYKLHRTGIPTFDTVMQNLRNIRDNCKKQTLSVVIRTNVSIEMLDDLNEIIFLYQKEFGNDKRFSFFFRPVGDWGGERVKEMQSLIFDTSQHYMLYDKLADSTINLKYKMYYLELIKGVDICYASKYNSYVVGSDLKLYKCSCKFNAQSNHIGWISSDGKMELDTNLTAQWLSVGLSHSRKCESCVLYPVCHNASCIADGRVGRRYLYRFPP